MLSIAQFAHQQKYQTPSQFLGYRTACQDPLQPDFTFRGRTLRSFRNYMANWRNEVVLPPKFHPRILSVWEPVGLKPMTFEFGPTQWQFVEITDARELRLEGALMQHCVATYHRECAVGRSSIWSLRQSFGEKTTREVTIEYLPKVGAICQAKTKHNGKPSRFQARLIKRWAAENEITVSL